MSKFEQFMLLVLICTGVFYIVFEYNSRKMEELKRKQELDEKVMAALKKDYNSDTRGARRFRVY